MANSGTLLGNNVVITGNAYARYRTEWQLAGQDVGGNFSNINWQTYVDFFGGDAQLDNGRTDASVGNVWYNGGRIYNYAGNFSNHTIHCASGSFSIGHNNDGSQSINFSGGVDVYQSGRSSGSGSWGLPTIPRYAVIDVFNVEWVTDSAIRFVWHADRGCDYVSWWSSQIDGGAHHDEFVGDSQGFFIRELHGLQSEKTYDIRVAVRNNVSDLWTESNTQYPTTGQQNKFFGLEF